MAVVLTAWAPSREAYEAVNDIVGREAPPGCIVHTASEVDGKVRITDVWESQQHIQDFFESKLGPAFQQLGVEMDRPEMIETFWIEMDRPEMIETFWIERTS